MSAKHYHHQLHHKKQQLHKSELQLTLWCTATKKDVEDHFATHGTGVVKEIKVMNGFGFIEYEDPMDARDVVPGTLSSS